MAANPQPDPGGAPEPACATPVSTSDIRGQKERTMNRSSGSLVASFGALRTNTRRLSFCGAVLALWCGSAYAHHGWSWAEEEQSTLEGTIEAVSMAPPHPTLRVKAADGRVWQVDLGNPRQTERSGFRGDTAKAGDAITVLGNRTKEPDKPHMKAVRITVGGQHYDMYPERIQE